MARAYKEFNFNDDIELMNLTYKMDTGNFANFEDDNEINKEEILKNEQPKIGL